VPRASPSPSPPEKTAKNQKLIAAIPAVKTPLQKSGCAFIIAPMFDLNN
jgi:hypothetical protein